MNALGARRLVRAGLASIAIGLALSIASLLLRTQCAGGLVQGGGCTLIFDWSTLLPSTLLMAAGAGSVALGLYRRDRPA